MATTATTYINQKLLADYMGLSKQRVHQFIKNGELPATYEPEMKDHGIRIADAIQFLLIKSAKFKGRSHYSNARAGLYYKAASALLHLLPEREHDAILPSPKATATANVVTLDAARSKRNEA